MDTSDSSTSADKDDKYPNLWQTRCRDLNVQHMLPLITYSDKSSDDEFSFASTSQDLSENEMFNNPQVETCNVKKLKIITSVEECQPHSKHINQVKLRSEKQIHLKVPQLINKLTQ